MHPTSHPFEETTTPLIREAVHLAQSIHLWPHTKTDGQPEAFLVGGAVRDLICHVLPKDVDIEVYHLPHAQLDTLLRQLYGKSVKNNIHFGTWEILTPAGQLNISIPRTETYYGPHHSDVTVTLNPHLPFKRALARRDFTMNAILVNLLTGSIHDPYHGHGDIKAGTLRAVNAQTFTHDTLRAWRAVQFVARYRLKPNHALVKLLAQMAGDAAMSILSNERILAECDKLFLPHSSPSLGLELAKTTGLLKARITSLNRLARNSPVWEKLKTDLDALTTQTASTVQCWQTIVKALNETERSVLIRELVLPKKYRVTQS